MIAIVQQNLDGKVTALVRRAYRSETVQGHHPDLKPRDRIEVKRQVNNPYLVYVGREVK